MKKIFDENFFNTDAKTLAQNLIGKWLVCNINNKEMTGQICETEAYLGVGDSACHSYKGKKTQRNKLMWDKAGTIYVYLCYGLHEMFNIVCSAENDPQAVLIRGVVGCVGPGRLTKKFNISRIQNGYNVMDKNSEISIYDDGKKYLFTKDKRIGIDYANKKDKNAKLRFILK